MLIQNGYSSIHVYTCKCTCTCKGMPFAPKADWALYILVCTSHLVLRFQTESLLTSQPHSYGTCNYATMFIVMWCFVTCNNQVLCICNGIPVFYNLHVHVFMTESKKIVNIPVAVYMLKGPAPELIGGLFNMQIWPTLVNSIVSNKYSNTHKHSSCDKQTYPKLSFTESHSWVAHDVWLA